MSSDMGKDDAPWAPDPDELLSRAKAAALLGVSIRTFLRYAADTPSLPAYKLPGGHRRWRRRDVLDLAELIHRDAG